ncbi:MAG: HigA family addiction module antidote protein [Opitutales bacterium]|nr:HigA family addiction module antidote protein [Opitutales bacterium]
MSKKIRLIHPGEHLREILDELGVSQYRFARVCKIPASAICSICAGKRSITAGTAIRIARALNMTPQFWMNFQARYDYELTMNTINKADLEEITPLVPAA